LVLWLSGAPVAQERSLTLSIGDAEDYGVELTDGPSPINPSAVRYCVRLPEGSTIDRYTGAAWRPGQKPSAPTEPASATVTIGGLGGGGNTSLAPSSGPTAWIQLETGEAYVSFVNADGNVEGATWEARPPRMFIRRDAVSRIHVCVGRAGMQPPAVP
jgi:hypothetical protein